jgi:hypothetical protein
MRTVILVGALILSDAIRNSTAMVYSNDTGKFIVTILVCAIIADIVDFLRNKKTA